MTALSYRESHSPSFLPRLLGVLALLLLLYVSVNMIYVYVAPPVDVEVIETAHAEIAHGAESLMIRACLGKAGAEQVWKSRSWRDPFKFFRLCTLLDGRVGIQIVRWSGAAGAYREVTSFIIKDGRPQQAMEYLSAIATKVR